MSHSFFAQAEKDAEPKEGETLCYSLDVNGSFFVCVCVCVRAVLWIAGRSPGREITKFFRYLLLWRI